MLRYFQDETFYPLLLKFARFEDFLTIFFTVKSNYNIIFLYEFIWNLLIINNAL